jgi:hypothetical protein
VSRQVTSLRRAASREKVSTSAFLSVWPILTVVPSSPDHQTIKPPNRPPSHLVLRLATWQPRRAASPDHLNSQPRSLACFISSSTKQAPSSDPHMQPNDLHLHHMQVTKEPRPVPTSSLGVRTVLSATSVPPTWHPASNKYVRSLLHTHLV